MQIYQTGLSLIGSIDSLTENEYALVFINCYYPVNIVVDVMYCVSGSFMHCLPTISKQPVKHFQTDQTGM